MTNQFKELDQIDRVPEELWTDVHDIVQEAVNKTIPKKEIQKGKMVVWGGLTNSFEKKRNKRLNLKSEDSLPVNYPCSYVHQSLRMSPHTYFATVANIAFLSSLDSKYFIMCITEYILISAEKLSISAVGNIGKTIQFY